MAKGKRQQPKKFEEAVERLEIIVQSMEKGDLPLDEALESFEEGMKLVRFCQSKLDEAQKRVDILIKDESGALVKQPFPVEE